MARITVSAVAEGKRFSTLMNCWAAGAKSDSSSWMDERWSASSRTMQRSKTKGCVRIRGSRTGKYSSSVYLLLFALQCVQVQAEQKKEEII